MKRLLQPPWPVLLSAAALAAFVPAPSHAAATDAPGGRGAALFQEKGCVGCHALRGQGGDVGPSLDDVSSRLRAEYIYQWLRDPQAIKPATTMPNLHLTDDERAELVFFLLDNDSTEAQKVKSDIGSKPIVSRISEGVFSNPPDIDPDSRDNDYLKLGVDRSYSDQERYSIQDQIQSFIPPIYEPVLTQSAFVLPPGALRFQTSYRNVARMDAGDVAGQRKLGARFVDFDLERSFVDFDAFLGLDHNMTLRVNIPLAFSRMDAELKPGFFEPVSVFPQGSSRALGDISVFLKKKFVDQGNFPIGLAGVAAIRIPTGSDDERFDPRTTVNIMGTDMLLPLPALDAAGMPIPGSADGTFRRFSNDGRLPSALQPGLGTFGGSFGLFATRILEGGSFYGRGAFHAGALYELRPEHDGVDPGNEATFFFSAVKPVYGDKVALDASYILKDQQNDSYAGLMLAPTAMGPLPMPRPTFSGGTTQFVGASLILTPNPLFQVTFSGLARLDKPAVGPSPDFVFRVGLQYTFASGLFK